MTDKSHEEKIAKQRKRESMETGVDEEGKAPLTKQRDDEIERRPERIIMPGGK